MTRVDRFRSFFRCNPYPVPPVSRTDPLWKVSNMKRSQLIPVVLVALAVLATITVAGQFRHDSSGSQQGIVWRTDLMVAHHEAKTVNRPLLITFGADWCGYCQRMEQGTLASPDIAQYVNRSFVPVKLDIEKHAEIARILEVKRIPCMIAISPQADLLGRMTGCVETDQFRDTLARIEELHRRIDHQMREHSR